jgi:stage II sporulation protein D
MYFVMLRFQAMVLAGAVMLASCAVYRSASPSDSRQPAGPIDELKLDAALERAAAASLGDREGSVIVIDPQNGRLRAVVNPRLAFEQSFPPGSAIKPFTALAALRAGLIDLEFSHQCRTRYARDGFEIVCSHPRSKSPFNLAHALAYSCNDYFARIGERLSEGAFNRTLDSFGFGRKTGVNAGESAGSLAQGDWNAATPLGESDRLLVTPVQLISAFAAMVNGGHLYRPQQSIDQALVPEEKLRLNIAPQHRDVLIEGMRGSVKYGTAAKAALGDLPGFVFGKTGTSTASNRWRTQGWFVGFAADKSPAGMANGEHVTVGVLVFLKRAHGSQCAEVAKPVLECAMTGGCVAEKQAAGESVQRAAASEIPESSGALKIRVHSVSGKTTRELPIEEYLVGVLSGEASVENEIEALKAQAVISRTFALKNLDRHAGEGFDLCSTTHCQRFVMPAPAGTLSAPARRAVAETAGLILQDRSRHTVDAYFHAACGGVTANLKTLWGAPAPDYLRGVRDDFCATMPHRRWTQAIPAAQLAKALQSDERTDAGPRLVSIVVSRRDATGRAETITVNGERRRVVRGWDFKIIVGRALGWQMIKSSRFEVTRAGGDFVFRGSGFGHGLGLCQEGAHVAARRGMNFRQILDHYYPGTRLGSLSKKSMLNAMPALVPAVNLNDRTSGNQRQTVSSEHFRASVAAVADLRQAEAALRILESARDDLVGRLEKASLRLDVNSPFEVVIHSSTAEFIEATGHSGWAAGVTRGRKIELQPIELLRRRGILASALRHELAHAGIEVLSGGRSPRWLAEGLAIHFAGEGRSMMRVEIESNLSLDELERRLSRPASPGETRKLYAAAYRALRALIRSEGESNVWRRAAKFKEPRI